jgi:hypothetical protein
MAGGSSLQWDPVWRLYRPLKGLPYDVRQRKVLDIAIDEVTGALSMHTAPPAIRTIVVLAGVTVLLGLHNGFIIHHVAGPVRWVPPYLTSL